MKVIQQTVLYEQAMDPRFLDEVYGIPGGEKIKDCVQCGTCGGSLMGTREEVALRLCRNLLLCAEQDGADCIAVTCPLCQINLDAYQISINKSYGTDFHFPIVYFTQLMGLAFGLKIVELGLQRCIVPATDVVSRFAEVNS
jgi:heterodisulfide reductase subunit B